jgi:hypothetical protein
LFKFVKVLNRLVDSMTALQNRADAVLAIMQSKLNFKPTATPVPALDTFPNIPLSPASVWVVFRSQTTVSVTLPLYDLGLTEIYIKYDKLVPLPSALYEIPRAILKRNADVHRAKRIPELHCCEKHYLLTSYTKVSLDPTRRSRHQVPYQRIDLTDLDADSTYYVTLYTGVVKFRTVLVLTLPQPTASCANSDTTKRKRGALTGAEGALESKDGGSDKESAGDEVDEGGSEEDSFAKAEHHGHSHTAAEKPCNKSVLAILPASLSVRDAEAAWADHCSGSASGERRTLIYTGAVCDSDQVLTTLCFVP